ncbi:hypothetical protein BDZ45DRAFT_685607 [Acephala macrosclerotiorum]|nr:hypothetical protein BDZ45DRAFT_685607 [Acephala macrosclerotiorum]
MCITYAWQYSCGCLAPKPSSGKPIHRCTSWHYHQPCSPTPLYSYLSILCSPDCDGLSENLTSSREDDFHLFYGKFDGMTSAEDRYFGRTRSPEGCRPERPPLRRPRARRVFLPVHADFDVVGASERGRGGEHGDERERQVKLAVEGEDEEDFLSRSKVWSRRKR